MSQKTKSYSKNCIYKGKKTKGSNISSSNMEPDNSSNFNMIIKCEILKTLFKSFMKCQICDSDFVAL